MSLGTRARIRRDGLIIVVSLVVFGVSAAISSDGRVGSVERFFFRLINDRPGWLRPGMQFAQYAGVLVVPLIAAAIAAAFRKWRLAIALVIALPLKMLAERIAKHLVIRQRPGSTEPHFILRGVPAHGQSFTSGHAFVAFVIAGLLMFVLPKRWAIVALVGAALVCIARVYLGAHNPLDVVGGAALGMATAALLDIALDVGRVDAPTPASAARPRS